MADNVQITAGSGTPVATDDVGGTHFQRVKLVDGTLDSATPIAGTSAGELLTVVNDMAVALKMLMEYIANPTNIDPATGRLRVSLDNIAAALTLATITTVTTVTTVTTCSTVTSVTNKTQEGGVPSNSTVFDAMQNNWANSVRRAIT